MLASLCNFCGRRQRRQQCQETPRRSASASSQNNTDKRQSTGELESDSTLAAALAGNDRQSILLAQNNVASSSTSTQSPKTPISAKHPRQLMASANNLTYASTASLGGPNSSSTLHPFSASIHAPSTHSIAESSPLLKFGASFRRTSNLSLGETMDPDTSPAASALLGRSAMLYSLDIPPLAAALEASLVALPVPPCPHPVRPPILATIRHVASIPAATLLLPPASSTAPPPQLLSAPPPPTSDSASYSCSDASPPTLLRSACASASFSRTPPRPRRLGRPRATSMPVLRVAGRERYVYARSRHCLIRAHVGSGVAVGEPRAPWDAPAGPHPPSDTACAALPHTNSSFLSHGSSCVWTGSSAAACLGPWRPDTAATATSPKAITIHSIGSVSHHPNSAAIQQPLDSDAHPTSAQHDAPLAAASPPPPPPTSPGGRLFRPLALAPHPFALTATRSVRAGAATTGATVPSGAHHESPRTALAPSQSPRAAGAVGHGRADMPDPYLPVSIDSHHRFTVSLVTYDPFLDLSWHMQRRCSSAPARLFWYWCPALSIPPSFSSDSLPPPVSPP